MNIFDFDGIGTHWWITIYDDLSSEKVTFLKNSILYLVKEFNDNYSRFKDDSFVGILNNEKRVVGFPQELYEIISFYLKVHEVTHNNFNIFVGAYLTNLGYDKNYSFTKKHEISDIKELNIQNGFKTFTPELIEIEKNLSVDLGGIGKGWLIDRIKFLLLENYVKYFAVNGGGDIYATSNHDEPLDFYLENPFDDKESIGSISIKNSSICSSGTQKRRWKDKNTDIEYHHLINLQTFEPVKEIAGVFTWGKSALHADTASTCIFVSPTEIYENIRQLFDIEFMVVYNDGNYVKTQNYPGILNT